MPNDKELDSNLQAPQEANATKHINFMEVEENQASGDNGNSEVFKEDDSPTKKQWEEMRQELREDDTTKE